MHEVPFDLSAMKAIWDEIEANDDAGLRDMKSEVSRKYQTVLENPLSCSTVPWSSSLSPKEVMLYLIDVMDFIHGVNSFYRNVKSIRTLTARDMEVDKHLSILLEQARQNMASLKQWNESCARVTELNSSKILPMEAPTKRAV